MARDGPAPSTRWTTTHTVLRAIPVVALAFAVPRLLDHLGVRDVDFAPSGLGVGVAVDDARHRAAGETLRSFRGFAVSVASAPPGARVLVDGRDMGEAPLVAPVRCAPGDPVHVEVRKPAFGAEHRVTTCRADTLVELSVELAARPAR